MCFRSLNILRRKQGILSIHRLLHRVHDVFTLTCTSSFQTIVRASAYLRHCPQPLLLAESFQPFHAVDTCSIEVERRWLVNSFLRIILRRVRLVLCTGSSGGELWSQERMPDPYPFPFLGKLLTHVGLYLLTMPYE